MARLNKLTTERSKAFHRIGTLYVELSRLKSDSEEYVRILNEIAELKSEVNRLQRRIVISRMKRAESFFGEE